jgi:ATP-dependent DNA ligase
LPGRKETTWLKLKRVPESLDLLIIGAKWGYGRRHEFLSNLTLAVWDKDEMSPICKTYRGLTNKEMGMLTEKLLELRLNNDDNGVSVKPKIVVEVIYDDIQRSSIYRCGYTLRQTRIREIRWDKSADEADDLRRVRTIYKELHG